MSNVQKGHLRLVLDVFVKFQIVFYICFFVTYIRSEKENP